MLAELRSGLPVSLAPDSSPRIYEGNWSWDIGFLTISDDRLYYRGEEARFDLRRSEIKSISLGPGPVGWFGTGAVYVSWQDGDAGVHVFNLRPLRVSSMLEMARQTRRLAADLENWHREMQMAPGSLLPDSRLKICTDDQLGTPGFGEVTSVSPRTFVRGPLLARIFLFDTFVAVGIAILFGLRFPILDSISSASDPADLSPSGGAVLYIVATVWITRAVMLWPYWRSRESKPQPAPAIASSSPQREV